MTEEGTARITEMAALVFEPDRRKSFMGIMIIFLLTISIDSLSAADAYSSPSHKVRASLCPQAALGPAIVYVAPP